jgi:transposase InsO family protein
MSELSTTAIAAALGISRQGVIKRAQMEKWSYKERGQDIAWMTRSLPRDVLEALLSEGIIDDSEAHYEINTDAAIEGEFLAARDKDRKTAEMRAALIGMFLQREGTMTVEDFIDLYNAGAVSSTLRERLGSIGVSTFYRWLRAYRRGGKTPASLVPKYAMGSGPGSSLSELAQHYLRFYWLKDSRPSMRSAWIETKKALPNEEISYSTAARFLSAIPAIERDYKRYGACRMDTIDLPHLERNMSLYKSMDQLVSDHHCFDFLVEMDGRLFRPWITAVQDFRSSKIVGFWPSVYPSSLSICLAFYLAVSRYGACKTIHIDNGKDYRSMVLNGVTKTMTTYNEEGFLEEELVEIQGSFSHFSERVTFAKPYHGSSKGRLERTFGTFAQLFSKRMAGYVGSNTVERPEDAALYWRSINKKSRRTDVHRWDEFVRELASFIDYFNAEWHGEGAGMDGRTPDEVFAAEAVPLRPVSPDILALAFSRAERRRVGRNGVRLDGVWYWAEELLAYKGQDVIVRRQLAQADEVIITTARGGAICRARANWFLETGDLAADNARVNAAKSKALAMVRNAEAAAIRPPEGLRSLIDMARTAYPVEREGRHDLAMAAGAELDRPSANDQRMDDRKKANEFIDFLGKEE